ALREEPVLNPDGRPADLYLAESRSIGGLSGSPVFMDVLTAKRVLQPTYGIMAGHYEGRSPSRFRLLGSISGHFNVPNSQEDAIVAKDGENDVLVNAGIAMIVPAEHILKILNQFTAEEEKEAAEYRERKNSYIAVGNTEPQPNVTFGTTSTEFETRAVRTKENPNDS